MVSLIVGFPGSGKSYYAMEKIFCLLNDSENKDKALSHIEAIYTNINGVKFDKFKDSSIPLKKFQSDKFYSYLAQCYSIYQLGKDKENIDDELIAFSKEQGYHNCLIVFDECHDFFTTQDKIKIFWLTYHRHLFHEIILLTQNKSLIHSKYRAIPEIFIEAQPRSKKLFSNTLNYKKYASFSMRRSDLFATESLKIKDEVFALYTSGNKSTQKSILHKYIFLGIGSLVVMIGVFYFLVSDYITSKEELPKKQIKNTPIQKEPKAPKSHKKTSKNEEQENETLLVKFLCDTKNGCIFSDHSYPMNYVNKFLRQTNSKKLYTHHILLDSKRNYRVFELIISTNKKDLQKHFFYEKKTTQKRATLLEPVSNPLEKIKL